MMSTKTTTTTKVGKRGEVSLACVVLSSYYPVSLSRALAACWRIFVRECGDSFS